MEENTTTQHVTENLDEIKQEVEQARQEASIAQGLAQEAINQQTESQALEDEVSSLKTQLETLESQVTLLTQAIEMVSTEGKDKTTEDSEKPLKLSKYHVGDFVQVYDKHLPGWVNGKVLTPGKDFIEITTERGPISVGHSDNIRKQK